MEDNTPSSPALPPTPCGDDLPDESDAIVRALDLDDVHKKLSSGIDTAKAREGENRKNSDDTVLEPVEEEGDTENATEELVEIEKMNESKEEDIDDAENVEEEDTVVIEFSDGIEEVGVQKDDNMNVDEEPETEQVEDAIEEADEAVADPELIDDEAESESGLIETGDEQNLEENDGIEDEAKSEAPVENEQEMEMEMEMGQQSGELMDGMGPETEDEDGNEESSEAVENEDAMEEVTDAQMNEEEALLHVSANKGDFVAEKKAIFEAGLDSDELHSMLNPPSNPETILMDQESDIIVGVGGKLDEINMNDKIEKDMFEVTEGLNTSVKETVNEKDSNGNNKYETTEVDANSTDMDSESVLTESPTKIPAFVDEASEKEHSEKMNNIDIQMENLKLTACHISHWSVFIQVASMFFDIWFKIIFFLSLMMDRLKIGMCKQGDIRNNMKIDMEKNKSEKETSSLKKKVSLNEWLIVSDRFEGTKIGLYDSLSHMIRTLVRGCKRASFIRLRSNFIMEFLNSKDTKAVTELMNKARITCKELRLKVEQRCEKLEVMKDLFGGDFTEILKCIETAKDDELVSFMKSLAKESVKNMSGMKWIEFEHRMLRRYIGNDVTKARENGRVYLGSLTTFGLFCNYDMDIDDCDLMHLRSSGRREHDTIFTLLYIHLVERCANQWRKERECGNEEQVKNLRDALQSEWCKTIYASINKAQKQNMPLFSGKQQKGIELIECVMWEIMMKNECMDMVNIYWNISMLMRCVWVLKTGRKHVNIEDIERVSNKYRSSTVADIRDTFNGRALLAMVMSGLCRVYGEHDYIYRCFEFGHSVQKLNVYGKLPQVHVNDLMDLDIVKQIAVGRFVFVGKDLTNQESSESLTLRWNATKNVPFCAKPNQ